MRQLTIILFATLVATACTHSTATMGLTDTIVDDYGRTVVVPSKPQRVVSASPAVTEIIFALGANDLLVGRTEFCTYPPEASQIENIGGISNLNVEKIISLKPDLVISGSMIPERSVQKLAQLGVPTTCVIEKQHFDNLYDNIRTIGTLVGRNQQADSLVDLLQKRLSSIPIDTTNRKRPTVYYVVGYGGSGNFTAGGNTFIDDIIYLSGGQNIAHDITGWNYSSELLLANDPNYIILRREDSASFCTMNPYNKLSAVRNGNVITIESNTIDLQVPRNIDAIIYLRNRIAQKPTTN